jgi:hypothetical protein
MTRSCLPSYTFHLRNYVTNFDKTRYCGFTGVRDSSVGEATSYELDVRGSTHSRGDFSVLHSVQNGSEAHLASYPMGTGVKAAGAYSSPLGADVKNGGATPPLHHTSSRSGA